MARRRQKANKLVNQAGVASVKRQASKRRSIDVASNEPAEKCAKVDDDCELLLRIGHEKTYEDFGYLSLCAYVLSKS